MDEWIKTKIEELRKLERNWDSHHGNPISETALTAASRILHWFKSDLTDMKPALVPCSDGAVQLEWHRNGKDLEIHIDVDATVEVNWTEKVEGTQELEFYIQALKTKTSDGE